MKLKPFLAAVIALLLSAANLSSIAAGKRIDLLGDPASPAAAGRTITITPGTRWVNVEGGEIVNFMVGDKAFAWHFNGPLSVTRFDLNDVAPLGMLDHKVTAYISPNRDYIGGSDVPKF